MVLVNLIIEWLSFMNCVCGCGMLICLSSGLDSVAILFRSRFV